MIISTSEFINEVTIRTGRQILKSLCQFFVNGEKGKPIGFGTGFFIIINDKHYLITAAHVTNNSKIYVLKDKKSLRFTGVMDFVETGFIDFSFLQLDKESINIANEHYTFLQEDIILLNHKTTNKPQYFVCGFPSTKTKWKYGTDKIITDPFLFTTYTAKFTENAFKKNYTPEANIILKYNKNKIMKFGSNEILKGPEPYGISGCPLWFFSKLFTNEYNPDPCEIVLPIRLIGIMITYDYKDKIMFSTRIDVIINKMKQIIKAPSNNNSIKNSKIN